MKTGWIPNTFANPEGLIGSAYGFACGARGHKNIKDLEQLLGESVVNVDSITHEVAKQYGYLKQYMRKNRKPVPDNDIWIAASCLAHNCTLLTSDKHFERLPQVRVIWPTYWSLRFQNRGRNRNQKSD